MILFYSTYRTDIDKWDANHALPINWEYPLAVEATEVALQDAVVFSTCTTGFQTCILMMKQLGTN